MTDPALRAREMHENWGLRCCSPDSLAPWLADADRDARRKREFGVGEVQREQFCREANSAWCAGHQAAGRCVVLAEVLAKKSA